ncbi:S-adenosylmethionine:diacylglycerol 3-amino-3-carboxypropyl transferase [Beggiatoa alba B18LD]|uniref:S-adenosylmethionine:diacylglycerol 3-amino-3-carboxypropyl transferase n=1 Tax=Beggiatoa alba B18LD TaxID=395493 RepID=I3CHT0_9GAMM|nr:DUF3419 family protein [Beggiatoa alba]EIJ43173.1 S-adenosylmethionine:diacylglycerol 3-amino-3-carboxypropyl transferase [Beggiatoa alba B18LD]
MSAVSAELLKTAVHQNELMSRQGLLERLFSFWFNGFVYNQIWEDPQVDLQALQLTPESRILTIASGGCNILNYLIEKPAAIVAVDLNQYHMHLTRFKLAALAHLPHYDDFYDFFGYGDRPQNFEKYQTYIKPHLDAESVNFWEKPTSFTKSSARVHFFTKGLYRQARFGYFMRFLHKLSKVAGYDLSKILQANSISDQEKIFAEEIAPLFDHWFVKLIGNFSFAVFSLGIPPQQYDYMKEESDGNLVKLYRERVKRLSCQFPIDNNYFAWQAFSSSYDHEKRIAIPDYLKPEHFGVLKDNVHRVETHVTSLMGCLRKQPNASLDRFVFLDSQDWMTPEALTELWQEIARVGKAGTRIIFRTASPESPIETALPTALRARFVYEEQRSQELFKQDRSAIYGGFHIYSLA